MLTKAVDGPEEATKAKWQPCSVSVMPIYLHKNMYVYFIAFMKAYLSFSRAQKST